MIEFEYFRLGSHLPDGIDDLLFKQRQFGIASHPAPDEYGVETFGSQSLAEFG